jgi:hypothetical protein
MGGLDQKPFPISIALIVASLATPLLLKVMKGG